MPSAASDVTLPPREEYYVAVAASLKRGGGSATIAQIESDVAHSLALSNKQLTVPHGEGSRSQFQYELAWVRTYLKWAGALDNPGRGLWRLTAAGMAMSDEELRTVWKEVVARQREERKRLPKLPDQGPGPHFTVERGELAFAKDVTSAGNDLRRLRGLQPIMRETAAELVEALRDHEGLWPALERAANGYSALISRDLNTVDFGRLFGQGIVLANAVRVAKAENRVGNVYELAGNPLALAESLLDLHGPFILGSRDGQSLVSDAERYGADSAQRAAIDDVEITLSRALVTSAAPASREVKEHISDILSGDPTSRPDQQQAYRGGLVRNAVIVLVGVAVVSAAATVGGPIPATLLGLAVATFGKDAVKGSKAGKAIVAGLEKLVDAMTVDFINDNEGLFRAFANRPGFAWMNSALDWSLSQRTREVSGLPATGSAPFTKNFEILIIEPNQDRSESLKGLLSSWGLNAPFAARTLASAIEWTRTHTPSLIVSETVAANGSSGIAIASDIQQKFNCPLVFVTSYPNRLLNEHPRGDFSLVTRPFDEQELRQQIFALLPNEATT